MSWVKYEHFALVLGWASKEASKVGFKEDFKEYSTAMRSAGGTSRRTHA